jgi:uncharacterized protein YacL
MMPDAHEPTPEEPLVASALPPRRTLSPSDMAEQQRRSQRLALMVLRLIFIVMLVTVTVLTLATRDDLTPEEFQFTKIIAISLVSGAVGVIVLLLDAKTPNKRLTSMVGVYLGLCAGLVAALAIGALIDVVASAWRLNSANLTAYIGLAKVIVGIVLCYLAVSIVLTTKDDFRLVIPYVEFAKQIRGVRPLLIDTSVLIDGRIDGFGQTGFLDAPLVVPQFVIEELQTLADSGDKLKRARGRRGLSMVSKLQGNPFVDVSIDTTDIPRKSVDHMLIELAKQQSLRILTTDYNLNKVAEIHGVTALNLNDLGNTLKSQAVPGDTLVVEVIKPGEGPNQGVGYMPDGTMVVIEEAAPHVGKTVSLLVTNSLQTTAGRMIFGTLKDVSNGEAFSHVESIAKAATSQPKVPVRTVKVDGGAASATGASAPPIESRRNPRR